MSTLLEKAMVMIAAHYGQAIIFRAKGSDFWSSNAGDYPTLSWNWEAYDYEIASDTEPGTPSPEAQASALPPLAPSEGDDSGEPTKADPGASSAK